MCVLHAWKVKVRGRKGPSAHSHLLTGRSLSCPAPWPSCDFPCAPFPSPPPVSFPFEDNTFCIHWLFSLTSSFVLPTPFMNVTEDFSPWNAVTSSETLLDLSGSLETCALLLATLTVASWSSLTSLISAVIWPFFTLCSLSEQLFLYTWVKSVSADTTWLQLCSWVFPGQLGTASSQFDGHLKIKIAWTYCPFPRHPDPRFPRLLYFITSQPPSQKPGTCPESLLHLTGFQNYGLPCCNMLMFLCFHHTFSVLQTNF